MHKIAQSLHIMHDKNQNDLLFFWVKNDKKYPLLAPLAQDILVISASSTPIERIFFNCWLLYKWQKEQTSRKQLGM